MLYQLSYTRVAGNLAVGGSAINAPPPPEPLLLVVLPSHNSLARHV